MIQDLSENRAIIDTSHIIIKPILCAAFTFSAAVFFLPILG
jgi:hypothetical protein